MTELEIRGAIAAKIEGLGSSQVGIVRHRGHYASSDAEFLRLVTNRDTNEVRGWIVRYLGWSNAPGGGASVERRLRYAIITMLGAEEARVLDGLNSEDVFCEMIENVDQAFRVAPFVSISGETVYLSYLQAPNDAVVLPLGERRVHMLVATITAEVNWC